jgi:hypothetical protein
MKNTKYELTSETKKIGSETLYRIRALRAFEGVKEGDFGGFIAKEGNLSVSGDAWVFDNASVSGNARVFGDAWVLGNASVFGNACVSGDARVFDNARVFGDASVSGNASVSGDARVSGDASVSSARLKSGWCFARKMPNWEVTEIEDRENILLVKNYKPAEKKHVITIDGKDIELSEESFNSLKEQLI